MEVCRVLNLQRGVTNDGAAKGVKERCGYSSNEFGGGGKQTTGAVGEALGMNLFPLSRSDLV
jgi:hypothetical protein